MSKPVFQPAPRPRPRTSPEEAGRLATAASDLGFTRPSTAPEQPAPTKDPKGQVPKGEDAPVMVSLKVVVPKAWAVTLRKYAATRDITIRYAILEALVAQGFDFDLSLIPEDGRRTRGS